MGRTINLLKYLPPYLQEYVEIYHTMTAENPEFQFVADNCKRILNNTFIMYCNEDGIQRFENLLGIVASEIDTLEFRQSRVMVKWNDCIPYTMKALLNKLVAMQGNDDIQIILNGYFITIITHMDNRQSESLWELFNTMIPCNMDITHKNLVRCKTNGVFYIAAGMNCGRITVNEFTQHFNSSGTFKMGVGISSVRMTVNEFVQEFTAKGNANLGVGVANTEIIKIY